MAQLHKQKSFPREPGLKAPWLSRVLPAKAYWVLYRCLEKVNTRLVPRPELNAATRTDLMRRFRPEVDRLSELLGRDLVRLWRYDAIGPQRPTSKASGQ